MKYFKRLRSPAILLGVLVTLFTNANLFSQESDLLGCVRENNIQGAKEMIESGGDVNQEDELTGHTPLTLAIFNNNLEMAKFLISMGADINHQDKRTGYTPLMLALNSCRNDMAELLIEKGADIHMKATDGSTALILAAGCSQEVAGLLLSKGADIHVLTGRGLGVMTQCVMGIISDKVTTDLAALLLSNGAEIDEKNTFGSYEGYTPLFWAILMGDKEELVSFLIKNGANVNTTAKNGKTPLNLAVEAGNDNFVELLEANGAK